MYAPYVQGFLLALLGAAVNLEFSFDLIFGISLLPGGFFGVLAVFILPFPFCAIGPLLAALPSLFLWGHPWALPSALLEGILLAALRRRGRLDFMVFFDALYWVFAGAPLVYLFYRFFFQMIPGNAVAAATKQGANGVLSTVTAVFLVYVFTQLRGFVGKPKTYRLAREHFILFLNLALIFPLMAGICLYVNAQRITTLRDAELETETVMDLLISATDAGRSLPLIQNLRTTTDHRAFVLGAGGGVLWSNVLDPPRIFGANERILHRSGHTAIHAAAGETNPMKLWRGSVLRAEMPLAEGKKLIVEQDFGPDVDRLSLEMTLTFSFILAWLAATSGAAFLVGRWIVRPLERLRETAETVQRGERSSGWPDSQVLEIHDLRDSLIAMTGALENREIELSEAKEAAEGLLRRSESYLAFMGHELKAPIAALLASLESPAPRDEALLRESLGRLLELINDILDQAAAGSGRLRLRSEPFDPLQEAASLLEPFSIQAKRKGLEFRLALDFPAGTRLQGDPLRYRQVLANLVSNAVKYTDRGTVSVSLGGRAGETGFTVQGRVEDTGQGIEPGQLDDIWKPFALAAGRFADGKSSHGLGLSIVRGILNAAGGTISVKSEPGRGTSFVFEIPYARPELGPASAKDGETASEPSLAGLKALVADDDKLSRMSLDHHLRRWGAAVEEASSGGEAIERFKGERFDLVVLDERMPGLTGRECAEAMRELERAEGRKPVFLIVASADALNRSGTASGEAREKEIDAVLLKPLDRASFGALLARRFTRPLDAV